jgi:alpha-N-acetylglucosaminidase
MKILKQFFSVLFVLLCVVGTGYAATFDGVRELVSRRAPWLGKHIQFKEIASSDGDCFILQTVGKKLVVQATGANAAAVGVNWYLKYYCHRSMSHLGDQLAPVTELPVIGQPVTVKTTSIYRYALNYCTFNYTMSFYDWDDWQWELDWMALNGVNLMLVANGSEAVWQNTLRRMNYSEKEIADFISWLGPLDYRHKIFIAGNHDDCLDANGKYRRLGWPYASVTDRQPEETGAENAEAYEVIGD